MYFVLPLAFSKIYLLERDICSKKIEKKLDIEHNKLLKWVFVLAFFVEAHTQYTIMQQTAYHRGKEIHNAIHTSSDRSDFVTCND